MCAVRAPFSWFGGKSVASPDVWRLLGGVDAYVEPFAGSLAVLLAREGIGPVETVNDADGFIANFWRALAADPLAVERAADWPVSECVPAGTLIATPTGDLNVEDIRPGMTVWGERDGVVVPTVVRAVRADTAAEFVLVGALRVTPAHPVWTTGGYIEAGNLAPGMMIGILLAHDRIRPSMDRVFIDRPPYHDDPIRRGDVQEPPPGGAPFTGAQGRAHASRLLDSVAPFAGAEAGHGDAYLWPGRGVAGGRDREDRHPSGERCQSDKPDGWRRRDAGGDSDEIPTGGIIQAAEGEAPVQGAQGGDDGVAPHGRDKIENRSGIGNAASLGGDTGRYGGEGTRSGHDDAGTGVGGGQSRHAPFARTSGQDRVAHHEPPSGSLCGNGHHLPIDHCRSAGSGGQRGVGISGDSQGRSLQRQSLPHRVAVYNFETDTGNYVADDVLVHNCDLTARHLWLVERRADLTARLQADPEHYDAKVAGWWLWGICSWIGSGWCNGDGPWTAVDGRLVKGAGRGINRQLPHLGSAGQGINRKLPHLGDAGQGIRRKLPHLSAGRGINRGGGGDWGAHTIAARLRRVRVCCGDWRRVVTPVAAEGGQRGSVGVFLDPPYTDASGEFYAVGDGSVWSEAAAWATDEADPDWRIVLAGYSGMWTPPRGWSTTVIPAARGGYQHGARSLTECLWASPSCMGGGLFGGAR